MTRFAQFGDNYVNPATVTCVVLWDGMPRIRMVDGNYIDITTPNTTVAEVVRSLEKAR